VREKEERGKRGITDVIGKQSARASAKALSEDDCLRGFEIGSRLDKRD